MRIVSPALSRAAAVPVLGLAALLVLAGCSEDQDALALPAATGNADRGSALIGDYGCGTCHTIPGIDGADGLVGPPLTSMGRRVYVAGLLRNTETNLIRWIMNPQAIVPGNAMPDMGLTEDEARDVAAYLLSLR